MVATDEHDHDDDDAPHAYKWNKRSLAIYAAHFVAGITKTVYEIAEGLRGDSIAAYNFDIGQREFSRSVTRDIETLTAGGTQGG